MALLPAPGRLHVQGPCAARTHAADAVARRGGGGWGGGPGGSGQRTGGGEERMLGGGEGAEVRRVDGADGAVEPPQPEGGVACRMGRLSARARCWRSCLPDGVKRRHVRR